jgi:hypothetical protein
VAITGGIRVAAGGIVRKSVIDHALVRGGNLARGVLAQYPGGSGARHPRYARRAARPRPMKCNKALKQQQVKLLLKEQLPHSWRETREGRRSVSVGR